MQKNLHSGAITTFSAEPINLATKPYRSVNWLDFVGFEVKLRPDIRLNLGFSAACQKYRCEHEKDQG